MAKRTNRVTWGLVAVQAVLLLVGSGVTLRYGVQVGDTRVHWHSLESFQVGRLLARGGGRIGKAYSVGWGAICVYRKTTPEMGSDEHELFIEITPDLLERVSTR
jgi:hypothetical protein